MRLKKKIIDAAIANGSIERVDELMSAAQILITEAHCIIDETIEILGYNKLRSGELQASANRYLKSAEEYFKLFASAVNKEENKMQMFKDIDEFDEKFREWAALEKHWSPKEVEE